MEYHISCKNPLSHYLEISLTISTWNKPRLYLQLPAWRPGRYELANYAKHLRSIHASGLRGKSLPISKVTKDRWVVETSGSSRITITYQYFAHQGDAGGSLIDDEQWYINFINCLLYTEERLTEPSTVTLELPKSYRVGTGLTLRKERQWAAKDYYQLVDSPLMASKKLKHWSYELESVSFHLWFHGQHKLSKSKTLKHFKSFSRLQINTLGEFPEKDYHFLYQVPPKKFYHGVEHANSTVIAIGPGSQLHKERYPDFLGVSSHELFHAWNILKIRPKNLLPYDFSKECYFEEGFVAEGFTTYYGDLFLARCGVFDEKQYFKEVDTLFKRHFENEGRHVASLTDSSRDLWLDGYQITAPDRKVSIYTKGALVALILDLNIRRLSGQRSSLDDVVRDLWQNFGKKDRGYRTEDVQRICKKFTKHDFQDLFDELIRGTAPLQDYLKDALSEVGCTLHKLPSKQTLKRCFGIRATLLDSSLKISQIANGSPAGKKLSVGDLILKINGKKVQKNLKKALGKAHTTKLLINRSGRQLSIKLTRSSKQFFWQYRLQKLPNPTDDQRINYQKWTGYPF